MIADAVTHQPVVTVTCPKCPKGAKGTLVRVDLSRLEEGLGHEGFKCDKCAHTIKFVPKDTP